MVRSLSNRLVHQETPSGRRAPPPTVATTPGEREAIAPLERADAMDAVNPLYIPRNHHVEAALIAAEEGDMAPWHALLEVVQNPYVHRPEWEVYAHPAPEDAAPHVTFCGT